MDTANVTVALGGERGSTVGKYNVTAAEIAVLRAIHGDDAVFDIIPGAPVERSNREELARLKHIYGKAVDGEQRAYVDTLYPGAAARVFEKLEELGLPDDYYKAEKRVAVKAAPEPAPAEVAGAPLTPAQKRAATAAAKKAAEEAAKAEALESEEEDFDDDGIEDLKAPGVLD